MQQQQQIVSCEAIPIVHRRWTKKKMSRGMHCGGLLYGAPERSLDNAVTFTGLQLVDREKKKAGVGYLGTSQTKTIPLPSLKHTADGVTYATSDGLGTVLLSRTESKWNAYVWTHRNVRDVAGAIPNGPHRPNVLLPAASTLHDLSDSMNWVLREKCGSFDAKMLDCRIFVTNSELYLATFLVSVATRTWVFAMSLPTTKEESVVPSLVFVQSLKFPQDSNLAVAAQPKLQLHGSTISAVSPFARHCSCGGYAHSTPVREPRQRPGKDCSPATPRDPVTVAVNVTSIEIQEQPSATATGEMRVSVLSRESVNYCLSSLNVKKLQNHVLDLTAADAGQHCIAIVSKSRDTNTVEVIFADCLQPWRMTTSMKFTQPNTQPIASVTYHSVREFLAILDGDSALTLVPRFGSSTMPLDLKTHSTAWGTRHGIGKSNVVNPKPEGDRGAGGGVSVSPSAPGSSSSPNNRVIFSSEDVPADLSNAGKTLSTMAAKRAALMKLVFLPSPADYPAGSRSSTPGGIDGPLLLCHDGIHAVVLLLKFKTHKENVLRGQVALLRPLIYHERPFVHFCMHWLSRTTVRTPKGEDLLLPHKLLFEGIVPTLRRIRHPQHFASALLVLQERVFAELLSKKKIELAWCLMLVANAIQQFKESDADNAEGSESKKTPRATIVPSPAALATGTEGSAAGGGVPPTATSYHRSYAFTDKYILGIAGEASKQTETSMFQSRCAPLLSRPLKSVVEQRHRAQIGPQNTLAAVNRSFLKAVAAAMLQAPLPTTILPSGSNTVLREVVLQAMKEAVGTSQLQDGSWVVQIQSEFLDVADALTVLLTGSGLGRATRLWFHGDSIAVTPITTAVLPTPNAEQSQADVTKSSGTAAGKVVQRIDVKAEDLQPANGDLSNDLTLAADLAAAAGNVPLALFLTLLPERYHAALTLLELHFVANKECWSFFSSTQQKLNVEDIRHLGREGFSLGLHRSWSAVLDFILLQKVQSFAQRDALLKNVPSVITSVLLVLSLFCYRSPLECLELFNRAIQSTNEKAPSGTDVSVRRTVFQNLKMWVVGITARMHYTATIEAFTTNELLKHPAAVNDTKVAVLDSAAEFYALISKDRDVNAAIRGAVELLKGEGPVLMMIPVQTQTLAVCLRLHWYIHYALDLRQGVERRLQLSLSPPDDEKEDVAKAASDALQCASDALTLLTIFKNQVFPENDLQGLLLSAVVSASQFISFPAKEIGMEPSALKATLLEYLELSAIPKTDNAKMKKRCCALQDRLQEQSEADKLRAMMATAAASDNANEEQKKEEDGKDVGATAAPQAQAEGTAAHKKHYYPHLHLFSFVSSNFELGSHFPTAADEPSSPTEPLPPSSPAPAAATAPTKLLLLYNPALRFQRLLARVGASWSSAKHTWFHHTWPTDSMKEFWSFAGAFCPLDVDSVLLTGTSSPIREKTLVFSTAVSQQVDEQTGALIPSAAGEEHRRTSLLPASPLRSRAVVSTIDKDLLVPPERHARHPVYGKALFAVLCSEVPPLRTHTAIADRSGGTGGREVTGDTASAVVGPVSSTAAIEGKPTPGVLSTIVCEKDLEEKRKREEALKGPTVVATAVTQAKEKPSAAIEEAKPPASAVDGKTPPALVEGAKAPPPSAPVVTVGQTISPVIPTAASSATIAQLAASEKEVGGAGAAGDGGRHAFKAADVAWWEDAGTTGEEQPKAALPFADSDLGYADEVIHRLGVMAAIDNEIAPSEISGTTVTSEGGLRDEERPCRHRFQTHRHGHHHHHHRHHRHHRDKHRRQHEERREERAASPAARPLQLLTAASGVTGGIGVPSSVSAQPLAPTATQLQPPVGATQGAAMVQPTPGLAAVGLQPQLLQLNTERFEAKQVELFRFDPQHSSKPIPVATAAGGAIPPVPAAAPTALAPPVPPMAAPYSLATPQGYLPAAPPAPVGTTAAAGAQYPSLLHPPDASGLHIVNIADIEEEKKREKEEKKQKRLERKNSMSKEKEKGTEAERVAGHKQDMLAEDLGRIYDVIGVTEAPLPEGVTVVQDSHGQKHISSSPAVSVPAGVEGAPLTATQQLGFRKYVDDLLTKSMYHTDHKVQEPILPKMPGEAAKPSGVAASGQADAEKNARIVDEYTARQQALFELQQQQVLSMQQENTRMFQQVVQELRAIAQAGGVPSHISSGVPSDVGMSRAGTTVSFGGAAGSTLPSPSHPGGVAPSRSTLPDSLKKADTVMEAMDQRTQINRLENEVRELRQLQMEQSVQSAVQQRTGSVPTPAGTSSGMLKPGTSSNSVAVTATASTTDTATQPTGEAKPPQAQSAAQTVSLVTPSYGAGTQTSPSKTGAVEANAAQLAAAASLEELAKMQQQLDGVSNTASAVDAAIAASRQTLARHQALHNVVGDQREQNAMLDALKAQSAAIEHELRGTVPDDHRAAALRSPPQSRSVGSLQVSALQQGNDRVQQTVPAAEKPQTTPTATSSSPTRQQQEQQPSAGPTDGRPTMAVHELSFVPTGGPGENQNPTLPPGEGQEGSSVAVRGEGNGMVRFWASDVHHAPATMTVETEDVHAPISVAELLRTSKPTGARPKVVAHRGTTASSSTTASSARRTNDRTITPPPTMTVTGGELPTALVTGALTPGRSRSTGSGSRKQSPVFVDGRFAAYNSGMKPLSRNAPGTTASARKAQRQAAPGATRTSKAAAPTNGTKPLAASQPIIRISTAESVGETHNKSVTFAAGQQNSPSKKENTGVGAGKSAAATTTTVKSLAPAPKDQLTQKREDLRKQHTAQRLATIDRQLNAAH